MWGAVIAAVVGAVGGGVMRGVMAAKQNRIMVQAYKDAAKDVREATEEHSGQRLYDKMVNAGNAMAYENAMANEQAFTQNKNPGQTNNLMAIASDAALGASENANQAANAGRELGMSIEKGKNDAEYNAKTTKAQQMMKQAGIDFNVANQATQTAFDAAGGLAGTINDLAGGVRKNKKE